MKMSLRITNIDESSENIVWELRAKSVSVISTTRFKTAANTIKSARRYAKKFNISITSVIYYERFTDYKASLKFDWIER